VPSPSLEAPGYFAQLLRAGLIAGIAVAAVAFPVVAIAGLGVLAATDFIDNLPSQLRAAPSAQVSYVYAADGKTLITQFYEEYRKNVTINDISPYMQRAIVASEDTRFYEHHGVDTKGIVRAFVANQKSGGVSQGASTLTMQYVRNVQRDSAETPQQVPDATEQSIGRKLRELSLAVQVEKEMSKQAILTGYLNVAYFGHRAYGIYAAAEIYFSKLPKDLTLTESAMLAGLVQAPSAYDPFAHPALARAREAHVLGRLAATGTLTRAQAERAYRQPLHLTDGRTSRCTANA